MESQLQKLLQNRLEQVVENEQRNVSDEKWERKRKLLERRKAKILKVKGKGKIIHKTDREVFYTLHLQYLIKQNRFFYMEEEIEHRKAIFLEQTVIKDEEIIPSWESERYSIEPMEEWEDTAERAGFEYNRLKAVQYAERWWNSYNPAYKKFHVNCTNFISQCLKAGGAPMRGYPNRGQGWWMQNGSWSYSWSVAHSFRMYLGRSKTGLKANEVRNAAELQLGDVICYDFQGDGRFDHTTIVTAKDDYGMPLVNAHTSNSRMRYWSYEDSTAYTPNIQYKFFAINDQS
ncbi:amidase domain-containing protein [Bacillus smithii]|uniref:amidase domain-containing protein n=1 Tax=Bacillus smithii TaxID=1479 RepID=UPI002E1EE7A6|nr:amidase domain-containing protein [Bacillus smithii]